MDNAAHTPGPWTIEEYGDDDAPALVIHKDSETRVCFMATPGSHGDPAKIAADACLIEAAPDMLAVLKLARRSMIVSVTGISDRLTIHDIRRWIEQADAAIAKAEGKTP